MGRKCVRLLWSLAALAIVAALAPAVGSGDIDKHFFKVKLVSSGSVTTDYGNDRHQAGGTYIGVDGQESDSWSWEVLAVAKSVGSGPLVSTAGIFRSREDLSSNLVDYTIDMDGSILETTICPAVSHQTLTTDDKRGQATRHADWVGQPAPVTVAGGALKGGPGPSFTGFAGCIHRFDEHGLGFLGGASGDDAPVPRGTFNPRSDRSFTHTFPTIVNEGRDHDLSNLNQLHTSAGSGRLKVKIKAIDKEQYLKRGRGYHDTPRGRTAEIGS